MEFTIRLKPSEHQFVVEQGETILEAALRSGLSMRCSCTNGTCGKCKAKVISGRAGEVLHFDYMLSQAEKEDGAVLLCRTKAASDMVIEASETTGVSEIPRQQLTATVSKLKPIADDVMLLEVRTPRSQTLQFLAGQHVSLAIDGAPVRNKSIASCPCNGMQLQFHVHRTRDDRFADFVFSELKLRQPVSVAGPYGQFVLDEASERPIIFIAYETGFAPIRSLIEHAIAMEREAPMRLYWLASDEVTHYQANYCRSWQDAIDSFGFVPISVETGAPAGGVPGDVAWSALTEPERHLLQAASVVVADFPDLSGYDVYMNGPPSISAAASRVLLSHRLPRSRLFVDRLERF